MDVDDSIKNELRALNNAIEGTREFAKSEGKLYGEDFDYPGPPEYSRVKAWTVYNCGEVWSAREAILNGAKFDELKFTSIWKSDGTQNAMCDNCQIIFAGKEYIFTGD